MITPEEISKKAERSYPQVLVAWAQGDVDALFPMQVRANLSPVAGNVPATIAAVETLRANAKEQCGTGYSISWKQIRSRDFGNNSFPDSISIDTLGDFLQLADRKRHFDASCHVAQRIRDQLPGLAGWVSSHMRATATLAEPLEGLIQVAQFFLDHPWPDCYARQIPAAVDTKFVERHQAILREWLDELLPASAIQADEAKFALRFGLRDGQPHTTLRTLDEELQPELGLPFDELSLPLTSLARLQVRDVTVVIVENRLNLLTLPAIRRAIAIRGEGKAVTRLSRIKWLATNRVFYWGDIDVEGFQILSAIRSFFPHVRSLFMTDTVMNHHPRLVAEGSGATCGEPGNLTDGELSAFRKCNRGNQRLEQEHLPQDYVEGVIRAEVTVPADCCKTEEEAPNAQWKLK